MCAGEHRTRDELHGWHAGRGRTHELRGDRLVATADEYDGVHRLGANHLLGVHRHEVAQIHAGRVSEAFVDGNRRKLDRQSARKHHAALHRSDEVRGVAVTGIVTAAGVDDADDRARQRVGGITGALDEGVAEEQGECLVAVARQALAKSGGGRVVGHGVRAASNANFATGVEAVRGTRGGGGRRKKARAHGPG